MPQQNAIARRQSDALKLEVLQRYFDFSNGRPTAASIAREMSVSQETVAGWLSDPRNAGYLDEIVPLWPNLGRAREIASAHADQMLMVCIDIANGKIDKARVADRLKAAEFVLGLAGVRPGEIPEVQVPAADQEDTKPAVLVNVHFDVPEGATIIDIPRPDEIIDGDRPRLLE